MRPSALLSLVCYFAASLIGPKLLAHDVVWWVDPNSSAPVFDFYYPAEKKDYISIAPSIDEPCTVVVNLDPQSSTLVSAKVLDPNRANVVDIQVNVLRPPNGTFENATVSGEWHATGFPPFSGCTSVTPNKFSVPVKVFGKPVRWQLMRSVDNKWLNIDTGFHCALQYASSLSGPWSVIGKGQMFSVNSEMPSGFYMRSTRVGGFVSGTVTDGANKPLSGISLGLQYGGEKITTGLLGGYSFDRLPWGMNVVTVSNKIGASLNVEVPATTNAVVGIKVAMDAAPPGTNAVCNCTPWCAIGFGTVAGGQTPVYFSGGANPPKDGTANCGAIQVTVTSPAGVTTPIVPGTSHHQNSGPNPAAGTWKVTVTVCGKTKTCMIDVP